MTWSFCFLEICNFHSCGKGKHRITTSVPIFRHERVIRAALKSMQVPSMLGSQIARTGVQ